ncbi:uncharacterized protein LOC103398663 [Cynoglossus semilaevis]|uniref:Growth arrest-specific 2 like 1 n=1 Tax=Cynoglossus semilaevis TaxID=244447 RepID=A0A3P8W195_CYNSE|nr:uncharacterized protein LOC103398663 [Cynoglossus semilaevis]
MVKVSEGKYKVGDSSALIFIRVLRTHVMVRVGGGWDTLEHYLDKHDPCRCAAFAHRYHQAKASSQGQGTQSKSSSAHSSRSASPGPHWRNEGIAPYKTPDRRTTELSSSQCSSASSTRTGRSQSSVVQSEPDSVAARTVLPQPQRDRSETRHINPLRTKETKLSLTRRLSGDSDSSTASSKGGGGGRYSLGGASRRSGEEVILLVNRKDGKHAIERGGAGNPTQSLRPSQLRARSHSRERSALTPTVKPNPPSGSSDGTRTTRGERGRSLGNEGPRRLHVPRSHSQSKLQSRTRSSDASPGPISLYKEPQPPQSDKREGLRAKQVMPSSPRVGGGFSKRQSSSCSNSPLKGVQSNNSPTKKNITTPRPPATCSPSVGRSKLPPVTSGGRWSPHSSPHTPRRQVAQSTRISQGSRSVGRGNHSNWPNNPEHVEPEEEGLGFGFQLFPMLDAQREQDLYRSFEAEFLANTKQAKVVSNKTAGGGVTVQRDRTFNPSITDSAYSSSNSPVPSQNVGAKMGTLPELRESKRTHHCYLQLDDPLNLLYIHNIEGPTLGHQGKPVHWGENGGGFKKLPAISSPVEEKEVPTSLLGIGDTEKLLVNNQFSAESVFRCRTMNGDHREDPSTGGLSDQQVQPGWNTGPEGDVSLENHQSNLSFDQENGGGSDDLPLPKTCLSPVPLPISEDCSLQDSSSENSSMCFSLSESHSESPPPTSPLANGDTDGEMLQTKKNQKKANRAIPVSKHKLKSRMKIRTDNRAEKSPSRIPTPVSYKDLQPHNPLSPCHTPPLSPQTSRSIGHPTTCKTLHQAYAEMIHPHPHSPVLGHEACSYRRRSGSLDNEAWM